MVDIALHSVVLLYCTTCNKEFVLSLIFKDRFWRCKFLKDVQFKSIIFTRIYAIYPLRIVSEEVGIFLMMKLSHLLNDFSFSTDVEMMKSDRISGQRSLKTCIWVVNPTSHELRLSLDQSLCCIKADYQNPRYNLQSRTTVKTHVHSVSFFLFFYCFCKL